MSPQPVKQALFTPIRTKRTFEEMSTKINEYVSIQAAKDTYGVVIDPETFDVDYEATKALRA